MAKTKSKPQLVKIGKHYLAPDNVAGIKEAKEGLYIIMLRDQPEPQFPLWLSERGLEHALQFFDILGVEE
jgi:hypothetical protein